MAQPRINAMRMRPRMKLTALVTALLVVTIAAAGPQALPGGGADEAEARSHSPLRGWVGGFKTTVYYPTPEHWFAGPYQRFRGIHGPKRAAWLLSAHGVAMQGDGWSMRPTGPGTRRVNYVTGTAGWLNARGERTSPGGPYGWSNGAPAWLSCGWQNRRGEWTFPRNYLAKGQRMIWARGRPARWAGCDDVVFQAGVGRRLRFWNSVAVDPNLFPMHRTWFYIPAFRGTRCGGWFRADDTGGAISGRHLDIYRPPPRQPTSVGTRTDQRILIVRNRKPPANPCL